MNSLLVHYFRILSTYGMRSTVSRWINHLRNETIASLLRGSNLDKPVSVHAWIRTIRKQKHVSFLSLNDGSSHAGIQAVISASVLETCDHFTRQGLTTGASVNLQGRLTQKKGGRGVQHGEVELQVENVKILGVCDGAVRTAMHVNAFGKLES